MSKETRKITFSIQEDPDVLAQVDRIAAEQSTSRSALYRLAIRRLLFLTIVPETEKYPQKEPVSA